MNPKRTAACLLVFLLWIAPAGALDVDRKVVELRQVDLPLVSVTGLDFASVRVEVAHGEIVLGDPVLKTTKSYCVPEYSERRLKDVVEVPTYYYEVPYRTGAGVMVIRDGKGQVLHTARIDPLESYERFGYDHCPYARRQTLEEEFQLRFGGLQAKAEEGARDYFQRGAGEVLDDALFFNVVVRRVPLYTFKDKTHDYTDLNDATRLAGSAYVEMEGSVAGLSREGREELQRAVAVWEKALEESNLAEKSARINRKVTVKLHESLGVALMELGRPDRAVAQLEQATRYSSMITSRSNGTGTNDLLQRARNRKSRSGRNAGLPPSADELKSLIQRSDSYRGRIPVVILPPVERSRLEAEHVEFTTETIFATADQERADRETAVASGEENPYEHLVGQSAMQGFFLFLMPYPEKLSVFPSAVCDLTHLNRLRVPNHVFEDLPEEIGNLKALELLDLSGNRIQELPGSIGGLEQLEKLDLSGNRLESLPDEIARLGKLKVLQLKGNPLSPGEVERLKLLLPRCKIKA